MNTINLNTKISTLLKEHPDALETIISISPKFTKLRNPLLRKLMASRTSIAMASKIGKCSVNDFFAKLQPLGFLIDRTITELNDQQENVPEFMKKAAADNIAELDVRSIIEEGKDPLNLIIEKVKSLQQGQILKLVNSFEPAPLIQLLGKQGFEAYVEIINEDLVNTYFYKTKAVSIEETTPNKSTDWETKLHSYEGKTVTIDVRQLEMPLPMLTILEELDKLPKDKALFVYHKRIPVFLLPELTERKFDYRIMEISDAEVHLLIYKS